MAVNVTGVPWLKLAVQVGPQLTPTGSLVTVPLAAPAPVLVTVRARSCAGSKNAVANWALLITSVQVDPVKPAQSSAQPMNAILAAGVAVRVTEVFTG